MARDRWAEMALKRLEEKLTAMISHEKEVGASLIESERDILLAQIKKSKAHLEFIKDDSIKSIPIHIPGL